MAVSPEDLIASFDLQADWCARLGSPLYADLLTIARDDLASGGAVADVIRGFDLDPVGAALPLRYMGGLHRLVLLRIAPRLARHFPSVGGTPEESTLAADLLATTADHVGYLGDALAVAPQTNEVGRTALLFPALAAAVARDRRPVRLLEIGAAGGLNLMLDRYRYDMGSWQWGEVGSPVIHAQWRGVAPFTPHGLEVRERAGCDLAPIDVTDAQQRLRLLSFIWPDQVERFIRTEQAIAVAAASAPRVDRADAADWLAAELGRTPVGMVTVVQHSVMWQYLAPTTRESILSTLADRGSKATDHSPLVHIAFEPAGGPGAGGGFVLTMTRWPGGDSSILGTGHAHGAWVQWTG